MTDISKGFQRLTPRIIFTQWFLLNKRDSHWGSLPWSLMLHIWDYVYIYTYIYIDILHVNLKCYLLTNICQMVILKHRKYLFSIWFSAFFGVVPCIYIYILHINLQRRQKSGYDAQQWSYKGWLCKQQASRPRLMGIYRKVPMWFDNVRYIYIYV